MDNVHRGNRKRRAIKFDEIRGFLPRLGEKGLMRPIARPEKEISKCNIPWYSVTREQRPSEKEGKIRKRERVRLLPRLNIGAPTSSLYPSISPLDPPRQSFEPGNPAVLLPPPSLPPSPSPSSVGGTYLTTVICISILLKRKYLIKLAGNVVSRRRRGRMPDPPYRNFASQFILSSRRISTETWNIHPERTIRRLEEFRDPLLLPSFSFSFFKLEIYIYIYREGRRRMEFNRKLRYRFNRCRNRSDSVNIGIRGGEGSAWKGKRGDDRVPMKYVFQYRWRLYVCAHIYMYRGSVARNTTGPWKILRGIKAANMSLVGGGV